MIDVQGEVKLKEKNLIPLKVKERGGKLIAMIGILFLAMSCSTLKRSQESSKDQKTTTNTVTQEEVLPEPSYNELPKIGIILPPAGAKAYSYIGFLRELEKEKIPIEIIGGLEWGALLGGLYSTQAKANETEWKSFKIPEDFAKKSLLSSEIEARNILAIDKNIKDFFGDINLSSGKIPFVCASKNIQTGKTLIFSKGLYREAMNYCVSYPPFFKAYRNWASATFEVKLLTEYMKKRDINYIILLDAITSSNPLDGLKVPESVQMLWTEISEEIKKSDQFVHKVVKIPLNGNVLDLKLKKAFVLQGEKAGQRFISEDFSKFQF